MLEIVLIRAAIGWGCVSAALAAWVVISWRRECRRERELVDEQLHQAGLHRIGYETDDDARRRLAWVAARRALRSAEADASRFIDAYRQWQEESGVVERDSDGEVTVRKVSAR